MADNFAATAGVGTSIATDDISSVHYQRTKLSLGADGTAVDAVAGSGAISTAVQRIVHAGWQYETVAASQTAQVLGATGATGDVIHRILVIPATTGAGSIALLDNATSISVFVSGTLSDLKPFVIELGMISVSGAWKLTTGANVSAIGIGNFT